MLTKDTIKKLVLIREINTPPSEKYLFKNSDQHWHEKNLAINDKAHKAAFSATQVTPPTASDHTSAAN